MGTGMDDKLTAFLRVIDEEDNATGGGAASAVAGAMAASLVGMVARLSVGKKNMPYEDGEYATVNEQAQRLSAELFSGSNADSSAFDAVMTAFRLPKATEDEKAIRSRAIQEATVGATEVPMQNAERCATVLKLAHQLTGKSNVNAASDLECAVFLAEAGLKGALSNAEINISGIKDEQVVQAFKERVAELRLVLGSSANG